ncbi:MAG TPA: hypothetical protein VK932_10785 [Kofleriaceae bacterium]|nr:hypothetical protein [Kofleriaceae bacterium]
MSAAFGAGAAFGGAALPAAAGAFCWALATVAIPIIDKVVIAIREKVFMIDSPLPLLSNARALYSAGRAAHALGPGSVAAEGLP